MSGYGTYCRLNVHVGASRRDVIRAALKKVHPRFRYKWMARGERHRFLLTMLDFHERAQKIVRDYRL